MEHSTINALLHPDPARGRVADKVAVVTGAAGGIGAAIALTLLREGARVTLTDIDDGALSQLRQQIRAAGFNAQAVRHDVSDRESWGSVVDAVRERDGRLDILVNNAGVAATGDIADLTDAVWRDALNVNLHSVFLGIQTLLPLLKKTGSGSIVNISSIEAIVGEPLLPALNATKAAVSALSRSCALYFAREDLPVRVNSVLPGFINTPAVAKVAASMSDEQAAAFKSRILGAIPLKRLGEPVDIAELVLYLASDASRYATGADFVIDGGFTAH